MELWTTATSHDEAHRAAKVAVLPIGSFEQHGAHLPLATDTIVASAIARAVADTHPVLLLPPITFSCSHEHTGWAGTVSISSRTLNLLIADIADSLHDSGISKLVLVNGHGGNYVLSNVVQEANTRGPRMSLFPSRTDWDEAREAAQLATTGHEDMHAGELEVSILLSACPHVVRDSYQTSDHTSSDRPHLLVHGMRGYTASGVIGRPSLGTAEKGKAILDNLVTAFADHLNAIGEQER